MVDKRTAWHLFMDFVKDVALAVLGCAVLFAGAVGIEHIPMIIPGALGNPDVQSGFSRLSTHVAYFDILCVGGFTLKAMFKFMQEVFTPTSIS